MPAVGKVFDSANVTGLKFGKLSNTITYRKDSSRASHQTDSGIAQLEQQ